MSGNDTVDLQLYIGEQLRALRDANGKLQSEVARAARQCGFHWSAATVAGIELGRRQLSIEELLFLPYVLNAAKAYMREGEKIRAVGLTDLLPHDGWVRLSPASRIRAEVVLSGIHGTLAKNELPQHDSPAFRKAVRRLNALLDELVEHGETIIHIWPEVHQKYPLLAEVLRDAQDEAERKVARTCGVTPFAIALAARKLWGHGLTAERDRLIASQSTEGIPLRRIQALRGHATRSLLMQIEPLVAGLRLPSR